MPALRAIFACGSALFAALRWLWYGMIAVCALVMMRPQLRATSNYVKWNAFWHAPNPGGVRGNGEQRRS